jgi:D-alanine-D-alanine ligase
MRVVMGKLTVAVIFGGVSTEHEVSISSADNVISNMSGEKYNIIPIYITAGGRWLMYEGNTGNIKNIQWEKFGTPCQISADRGSKSIMRVSGQKVKNIPVDVIFPVLHGKNGEDGTIQGLFEISGIPYVGSGVLATALAMDKNFTKVIVNTLGIHQAKHLDFKNITDENMGAMLKKVRYQIGYTCFVKPSRAGSSVGVSKATDRESLKKAFYSALEVDDKILVEKNIVGRELECAVLGDGKGKMTISGVGEVLAGDEFYSFDAKYNSAESQTVIPADIPADKAEEIRDCAGRIFDALDCKGLSRVDFFLDDSGTVIFNEINTLPGFTDISMYPKLMEYIGIPPAELIDRLIDIAFIS